MKRIQASLMSLAVLGLLGTFAADTASAGVRVRATLETPTVRVRLGNTRVVYTPTCEIEPATVHIHKRGRLTARDHRIANRLSWYAGVPKRRVMKLRRKGYTWFGVGRFLHVPRPVVRAAMHQRSWKRFLRHEGYVVGHWGHRDHPGRRDRNIIHTREYNFQDSDDDNARGRRFKTYQMDD
jgi:hypothetical protein